MVTYRFLIHWRVTQVFCYIVCSLGYQSKQLALHHDSIKPKYTGQARFIVKCLRFLFLTVKK